MDVVDSVGDGIEDYYVGGAEARGEWIGAGGARARARRAGRRARRCGGCWPACDPSDGSSLRSSSSPARVGGFDLTFSAPKSVSVLFGVGDERAARAGAGGARRRRRGRRSATWSGRRRRSGAAMAARCVEEASGFVAAAFRHRTSRAGDPQLHTHVLVANLGRGADGRWSALDGRRLYAHARTASFVYQAVLRGELTRTVGVEWSPVRKGIAEVVGVRRRGAGRVQPAAGGDRGGARAARHVGRARGGGGGAGHAPAEGPASAAAGADRRVADAAAELGLGRDELALITGRARVEGAERARVGSPVRAARRPRRAHAAQGDVHARRGPPGASASGCRRAPASIARALEAAADRFLASEHVIALVADEPREGEAFRRRDGRVLPVDRQQLRYSTRAQLALEQRADRPRPRGSRAATPAWPTSGRSARALAARPTLSDEQRDVVERLCRDGDGVAVVAGRAGTGKTFALGRRARGVAGGRPSGARRRDRAPRRGRAARRAPGSRARARSRCSPTCATRGRPLPARCVLVVDEAGMVPTREIAELVDAVARGRRQARARRRPPPAARAAGRRRVPRARRSAGSRSSSPRTSARSTPGSATRSTSSATAEPEPGARRLRRPRPPHRRADRRRDARAARRGLVRRRRSRRRR